MFLFADDMIVYLDTLNKSIKKQLDITNEFTKVAGYKINIQKSVVCVYTNSKIAWKKKQMILFTRKKKTVPLVDYSSVNMVKIVA